MIKQVILTLATIFITLICHAQVPVFQSKELVVDQVKTGYYVLFPIENTLLVQEAWQGFLQREGKVQKSEPMVYQLSNPTSTILRDLDIASLTSQIKTGKGFTKVFCSFESNRNRFQDRDRLREISSWFEPFIQDVLSAQGKQLLALEIEQLQSQQKAMDREVSRLQTSIERNLKQQNKLDASIRRSPEELSKIISEKEELTQTLIQQGVPDEELQKQSVKKEKSINRIKSQAKRQEKQLTSKEKALQKLRTDFLQKEREKRMSQEVLDSKPKRS